MSRNSRTGGGPVGAVKKSNETGDARRSTQISPLLSIRVHPRSSAASWVFLIYSQLLWPRSRLAAGFPMCDAFERLRKAGWTPARKQDCLPPLRLTVFSNSRRKTPPASGVQSLRHRWRGLQPAAAGFSPQTNCFFQSRSTHRPNIRPAL